MLQVCLTGGIATGKSLVTERFSALGVPVADSDIAAREVVSPGSKGLAAITEAFGRDVLTRDGSLDRRALRQTIFSDDDARACLEDILHPLIREWIADRMECWERQGEVYALRAVPLLVEKGLHCSCQRILVVDAPESVQIERLIRRDGESERGARSIMARQAKRWDRLSVATDVIDNGDAVDPETSVAPQVLALHAKYLALAGRTRAGGSHLSRVSSTPGQR